MNLNTYRDTECYSHIPIHTRSLILATQTHAREMSAPTREKVLFGALCSIQLKRKQS